MLLDVVLLEVLGLVLLMMLMLMGCGRNPRLLVTLSSLLQLPRTPLRLLLLLGRRGGRLGLLPKDREDPESTTAPHGIGAKASSSCPRVCRSRGLPHGSRRIEGRTTWPSIPQRRGAETRRSSNPLASPTYTHIATSTVCSTHISGRGRRGGGHHVESSHPSHPGHATHPHPGHVHATHPRLEGLEGMHHIHSRDLREVLGAYGRIEIRHHNPTRSRSHKPSLLLSKELLHGIHETETRRPSNDTRRIRHGPHQSTRSGGH